MSHVRSTSDQTTQTKNDLWDSFLSSNFLFVCSSFWTSLELRTSQEKISAMLGSKPTGWPWEPKNDSSSYLSSKARWQLKTIRSKLTSFSSHSLCSVGLSFKTSIGTLFCKSTHKVYMYMYSRVFWHGKAPCLSDRKKTKIANVRFHIKLQAIMNKSIEIWKKKYRFD